MYLSTRISRLCKRSHFFSLSLHICVCVCVLDWYFRACSVCVCVGAGWRDYSPPGFQNYFLFPLSTSLFFSFLIIFPLPAIATKLPLSLPLFVMFMCVCVCVCACVFVTFYLCTSYFNRVAKFFGLLVFMYKYILIINLYKWHLSKKVWQLCIARMSEV